MSRKLQGTLFWASRNAVGSYLLMPAGGCRWSSNNERKPASAGPMAVKLMPSGSLKGRHMRTRKPCQHAHT
jgi:hypothetical protein